MKVGNECACNVFCVFVKETLSTSAAGGGATTTVEGVRVHILYAPFGKKESMKVVVEMRWAKGTLFYLTKNLQYDHYNNIMYK